MRKKNKSATVTLSLKKDYILALQSGQGYAEAFLEKYNALKLDIATIHVLHDDLLFVHTHAANPEIKLWAYRWLEKISNWCRRFAKRFEDKLDNSGLPFTHIYSHFSFTTSEWLLAQGCSASLNAFDEKSDSLNEIFQHTLPPFQRDVTQMGLNNLQLLKHLRVSEKNTLAFLLAQFAQLNCLPSLRDYLYDKQQFTIHLEINKKALSRTFNSITFAPYYFHSNWLKNIDTRQWTNNPLPREEQLTDQQKQEIAFTSKIKLILLQRETDPVTYMDLNTIKYFQLERGISIALFSMAYDKQLPYESYVGYTLYKNGYPAAYGGAWIFGFHALIGINIFEWCRGGESSLFFNNLLRVYHQVFTVRHFEVEPYQFGKDNDEGLRSGAFWFYYRTGFYPRDRKMKALAKREFDKMAKNKKYKTPLATLKKFTDSNLICHWNSQPYMEVNALKKKISGYVKQRFGNNVALAESQSLLLLFKLLPQLRELPEKICSEIAIMALAMNWLHSANAALLARLTESRLNNPYAYQETLRTLLLQNLHSEPMGKA